jgi:UDP-N-acetylglucosamine 2-epimerase (non-hydrolysing)
LRVVTVIGNRPQFVKAAAVSDRLRAGAHEVLVHTGQHYDDELSRVFFDELGLPRPDESLGVGSGSHAEQTARALVAVEQSLVNWRPDLVVVAGDVNSTLAAALVFAKLEISYGHVESGLRSFDRSMPEEINRIVADEFADHLFVHSDDAVENLAREGIADERVHLVGNTMIDTLQRLEPAFRSLRFCKRLGLEPGSFLLVTLHRPSLVEGPLLDPVLLELDALSAVAPVVFPVHPRTRTRITEPERYSNVRFLEPLGYLEFLSLESEAAAVLTDSGGVQEETTFLGISCFTLRTTTERPVTTRMGTNVLLGLDPTRIREIAARLERPPPARRIPPLWDGRAAERIADVVLDRLLDDRPPDPRPPRGRG